MNYIDQDENSDPSQKKSPETDPSEDGRNREWEDRARVNLEIVPEGTHTNVERDFEPEDTGGEKSTEADAAY